ncbi:MAG: DNA cytosine methyltransferase [Pseudolabrys sp.]
MALRTVDLFCGAGGSSIGARMAGAQIVGAIDSDPLAVATYEDNFPKAKVVLGRLDDNNGVRLLGDVGRVDLVLASPECTNHSVARGARAIDTASLDSGLYVLPFIRAWKPRFLVLENVSRMQRWDGWHSFLRELTKARYRHAVVILDAQHFGVPQARRRMFLLASREAIPPLEIDPGARKVRTAAEVLDPAGTYLARPVYGRSRPLAAATIERIKRGRKTVPETEDFIIVYYGSDAAGGWQPLDRPLRTLTTLDRFGLISGTGKQATLRMLQVPELRRAMGFPQSFKMDQGSRRDRIRLIGNAVCPPVMKAVIEALVDAAVAKPLGRIRSRELAAV